jgi:hypothetical protein
MKFLILFRQSGEGCDYTIGCGRAWIEVDADDASGADAAVMRWLEDRGDRPGNADRDAQLFELASVTIVPVGEARTFDLDALRSQRRRESDEAKLAAKRAQLAKLRAELGE